MLCRIGTYSEYTLVGSKNGKPVYWDSDKYTVVIKDNVISELSYVINLENIILGVETICGSEYFLVVAYTDVSSTITGYNLLDKICKCIVYMDRESIFGLYGLADCISNYCISGIFLRYRHGTLKPYIAERDDFRFLQGVDLYVSMLIKDAKIMLGYAGFKVGMVFKCKPYNEEHVVTVMYQGASIVCLRGKSDRTTLSYCGSSIVAMGKWGDMAVFDEPALYGTDYRIRVNGISASPLNWYRSVRDIIPDNFGDLKGVAVCPREISMPLGGGVLTQSLMETFDMWLDCDAEYNRLLEGIAYKLVQMYATDEFKGVLDGAFSRECVESGGYDDSYITKALGMLVD